MRYTLDGIEYDDEPKAPQPEFFDEMVSDVASFIDFLCSIPPLSWLDAALRGPVGPPK